MKIAFMLLLPLRLNAYHSTIIIKDIALESNFLNIIVNVFNSLQTASGQ